MSEIEMSFLLLHFKWAGFLIVIRAVHDCLQKDHNIFKIRLDR